MHTCTRISAVVREGTRLQIRGPVRNFVVDNLENCLIFLYRLANSSVQITVTLVVAPSTKGALPTKKINTSTTYDNPKALVLDLLVHSL